ncbi:MAG: HPP family protein [Gammaproteobacteria bacterium]|nr:HPP family protein [Gammaproteobacteria bacterium]
MHHRIMDVLGIERYHVSHTERLVSIAGALTGIMLVFSLSDYLLGKDAIVLVASMGASAVLLFAVPHGALSQPWSLLGGHVLSALVGVSCAQLITDVHIAGPVAVALAVGVMHYSRCLHPPGGATALVAVVGGERITGMAYDFVFAPVLLNAMIILLSAVAFNYFFHWRRYPSYFARRRPVRGEVDDQADVDDVDFAEVLGKIDSYIDVSETDLKTIFHLATQRQGHQRFDGSHLEPGECYSNGKYGALWSVREIVGKVEDEAQGGTRLAYKVVAGKGRRSSGIASADDFAGWAKYKVYRDEENWRRQSLG